jgi:hypothetical protein
VPSGTPSNPPLAAIVASSGNWGTKPLVTWGQLGAWPVL